MGLNTSDNLNEQGYSYDVPSGAYSAGITETYTLDTASVDSSNSILQKALDSASNASPTRNHIQEALRQLNWSRSYLWDVDLEGAPYPFNAGGQIGFPAIEVDDTIAIGDTFDFEAGLDFLRVPRRRSRVDIRITFYDLEDGRLELFFEDWFNRIYGAPSSNSSRTAGVEFLSNSVKKLTVRKLNSKRGKIYERVYNVFPNGTIMGVNKSTDSGPRMYMVDFCVAKYISRSV